MIKKITLYFILVISILFALVQYNDPDALLWIIIYGFVASLAFFATKGKISSLSFFLLAFIFLLWGINQYPPEWEGVLLNQVGMKTLNIELGREAFGLFICSLFCLIMGLMSKVERIF